MNRITVLGWILCLAQIFSCVSTHDKITKNEFGSPGLKQGVLQVLRRNRRETHKSYVLFDNRSGRQIELWWKAKGKEKIRYKTSAPGETSLVDTSVYHQWIATDKITKRQLLIDNSAIYTPQRNTKDTRNIIIIRRPGQNDVEIGEKYIETMVVVDKSVVEFHKNADDVRIYVLYLLKLASQVLQHPSLSENFGVKVTMVLSKLVSLEDDKKEILIKQYSNFKSSGKNLDSVCSYMNKIRNNGIVKFDHKLFLTRKKFGYSGLGQESGMCSQYRSCSLVLDVGFSTPIVIAHEIGHLLGTDDLNRGRDQKFIMGKPVKARLNNHAWSTNSKVSILRNIRRKRCLNNKPSMENKQFPVLHKYPGVYYSLVKQCELAFDMNHSYWEASKPCEELMCQLPPPYSNFFYPTKLPALDGTKCDNNKWCLDGSCQTRKPDIIAQAPIVPTFERLRRIHGNWGVWKAWKPCSKVCGIGVSTRERECNNPKPRNEGMYCVGASEEAKSCKIKDCPEKMSKEDELCTMEGMRKNRNRQWGFYNESKVNLNCDFESDTCHWKNDKLNDQQDWKLNKGKTPSAGTGPFEDHTQKTRQGQYLYFESSTPPSNKGYKARLSSPNLAFPQACLTFWYHMYGDRGMGSLTVIKSIRGITRKLWIKTGNQGNKWFQGQVEVKDDDLYQIHFVAQKLFNSYKSDIGLDSITFTSGPCEKTVQNKVTSKRCTVTCTTIDNKSPKNIFHIPTSYGMRHENCKNVVDCDGVPGSGKRHDSCGVCDGDGQSCKSPSNESLTNGTREDVDCDFEKDFCQWSNSRKKYNALYWLRRKGEGYYMFVQTSRYQRKGKLQAKLESPELRIPKACLSFDYKMNGENIIKLRVRLFENSRLVPGMKWARRGHQGSQWLKARVDITRTSMSPYKIVIEGLVGNSNHGDIAIDNIQFRNGSCG